MKTLTMLITIFMVTFLHAQTPCVNGFAGSYPCNDYDLMSRIPLSQMGGGEGNDSWGWTDPQNGDEYAIMGLTNGTVFVDISDPVNPVYLGKLPTATSNSTWRDIKVYNNHAFIVSEASGHGMQVFDLTRLRNVANPPQTFSADARYTEFGNAHNIVINEDTGYAYVVGAQRNGGTYRGGPLFINIQDPKNPTNAGGFLSGGQRAYTHDAQVITYNGPDSDYTGREILIGSNEIEVVIADITNKSNPTTIATIRYPDIGYTHQGWFTEDERYFILGDETDEQRVGFNTRTVVFDFQDLDNPVLHTTYTGPTPAIDHNGYVKGNTFYLANYRAGVRMIDVSDIGNENMTEIGFFDTYTGSNAASFNGVWNVYPYFSSGNIVVSDIEGGLFIIKKSGTVNCNVSVPNQVSVSSVSGNQATVSWSSITGAAYDVRYRTTGSGSWTVIAATGTSTTITGLSPQTDYEVQVRSKCGSDTSDYSASETFTTTETQLEYCDSNGNDVSDEYISNVSIGSINNTSGASAGGYIDYTSSQSTTLTKGKESVISITPTWTGNQYNEGYSVWIDLNVDGDFNDTGEQVFSQSPTQVTPVSGNIVVPESATNGITRMRVSMKYNTIPTSCESFQYGEVEDYAILIKEDDGTDDPSGCVGGVSSFPYIQGFEDTFGNWSQSSSDDIDWSVDSGGTPSRDTGPSSASAGTYYIFVEASGNGTGFPDKQAILTSPCFDLSDVSSASFSFDYHMYGANDMGSIALEVSDDNGASWTSLWSETGNKGNTWNSASVNLSTYAGTGIQLRFNRITGSTWQADIAIDNVNLSSSARSSDAITNLDLNDFMIFPNPTKGNYLNLYIKSIAKSTYTYEIKNVTGQLVSQGHVLQNKVDVSDLQKGVYFIQVTSGNQFFSERFIKK